MRRSRPPIQYFGVTLDSGIEASRFLYLREIQDAGRIRNLEPHPEFDVTLPGGRRRKYTGDFGYYDVARAEWIVEEVKPEKGRSLMGGFRDRMERAQMLNPDKVFYIVTVFKDGHVEAKPLMSKAAARRLEQSRALQVSA